MLRDNTEQPRPRSAEAPDVPPTPASGEFEAIATKVLFDYGEGKYNGNIKSAVKKLKSAHQADKERAVREELWRAKQYLAQQTSPTYLKPILTAA